MPCQQSVTPIFNGCRHAQLEIGLVRVEAQPSIPSCCCYFTYAEETTTYLSIYVDWRIQLPVSKWYLIDLTHDRITSATFTTAT
jgi:hypothetical protein